MGLRILCACLLALLVLTALVTGIHAIDYVDSRISPRGWKAARAASEELLSKLKVQGATLREEIQRPGKRQQLTAQLLGGLREKLLPPQTPSEPQAAESFQPQQQSQQQQPSDTESSPWSTQLILPAMALSLASAWLGWALRGVAEQQEQESLKSLAAALSSRTSRQKSQSAKSADVSGNEAEKANGSTNVEHGEVISAASRLTAPEAEEQLETTATAELESAATGVVETEPASHEQSNPPPAEPKAAAEPQEASTSDAEDALQEPAAMPSAISEPSTPQARGSGLRACDRLTQRVAAAESSVGASPGWLRRRADETPQPSPGLLLRPARSAVDDVTAVAEALADQLCLDVDSLSPQERMQLLQMALQCCQHRDNTWLHSQANEISFSHAAVAHDTLQHKRHKAAVEAAAKQVEQLRAALQDGLLAGLSLMLVLLLLCGVRCGFLGARLSRCESFSDLPAVSFWRPWAALEILRLLGCWGSAASDALLGCGIMLVTTAAVSRGAMLKGSTHSTPLLKLLLGLGCICGAAGYLAVSKLGGHGPTWLALWEAWLSLHLLASWQLPALQAALLGGKWAGTKATICQASLSLAVPAAAGLLPFPGCTNLLCGHLTALFHS